MLLEQRYQLPLKFWDSCDRISDSKLLLCDVMCNWREHETMWVMLEKYVKFFGLGLNKLGHTYYILNDAFNSSSLAALIDRPKKGAFNNSVKTLCI